MNLIASIALILALARKPTERARSLPILERSYLRDSKHRIADRFRISFAAIVCSEPSHFTPLRMLGYEAAQLRLLKLANRPEWSPSLCECVSGSARKKMLFASLALTVALGMGRT